MDKFGLHTPCTMGFRPLTPISRTQISRNLTEKFVFNNLIPVREVLKPIYKLYKSSVSENNQCGTKFQIKENTTKFKIN